MPTTPNLLSIDASQLAQQIKDWGVELGFQQVGITDVDMAEHRDHLQEWLKKEDSKIEIPEPDLTDEDLKLFGRDFGGVCGIITHLGNLSEQAAINLVEFLIQTMINAQYFSDRIPTVGGQIHVALINPKDGFKWISKEEFKFKGHSVPRYEH